MEKNNSSFLANEISPKKQAIAAFIGVVIIGGFGSMMNLSEDLARSFPWMIGVAFMLVFAIFNSILWIPAKNMMTYLSESMTCYVLLAIASGIFSFLITGENPNEVGSIKWIFIVMTIGYFVFLGIMGFIKRFALFLNHEEERKLSGKYEQRRRRKRR